MIIKNITDVMSNSPNSLEEFSEFIKELCKEHSHKDIIKKSGIDKNVLYRAINQQNITLDNYYKIKKAYSDQLKSNNTSDGIDHLPILGQIVGETKVKMLNFSQPTTVPVTSGLIDRWSPVFGYLAVNETCYSGFVYVFSAKEIEDSNTINKQCINRMVMLYPHEEDPIYGMIIVVKDKYLLIHPQTRETLTEIPKKNNIKWAKFLCIIPFSLMENFKQGNTYESNIHNLETDFLTSKK
jgi:hypothetical protein